MCLLGAGVVLLLSALSYTMLPLYPPDAPAEHFQQSAQVALLDFSALPVSALVVILSCTAITLGYLLLRKHAIHLSSFVIWLIVVEALAESSILGWLIKTHGMTSPLPGSHWGILSSTWLEYLVGWPGALVLPVFILLLSYGYRRSLRKSAGENPQIQFFGFKFKATFR